MQGLCVKTRRICAQGLVLLAFGASSYAQADPVYTDRFIVKFRGAATAAQSHTRQHSLSQRARASLTRARTLASGAELMRLAAPVPADEAAVIAARLRADPNVVSAEPDLVMENLSLANDPYYGAQWNLSEALGGINLPAALALTHGASDIVVAVLDTGIVAHEDLGRVLPGYDFVSGDSAGNARANDGDGRDADPTDPGDWISVAESTSGGIFNGCYVRSSSWHGTHVAGIVGADGDNGKGIAGVNWTSPILPVRVLGKCGGYTSDIVDAMYWAAGFEVEGVPTNPNPARVINLSLGGTASTCPAAYQQAIDTLTAAGVVVVASAGNSMRDAASTTPANCAGVITVGASDRAGGKAWYSNYGAAVKIAAPGGVQYYLNDPDAVWSTLNSGTTVSGYDVYRGYQGTSMAAPHVSGVVSLMLSVNPDLSVAQVTTLLQSSARSFASDSTCTNVLCGAGIVDAAAAVTAARATVGEGRTGASGVAPTSVNDDSTASASGGGGCVASNTATFDPTLVVLLVASLLLSLRASLRKLVVRAGTR